MRIAARNYLSGKMWTVGFMFAFILLVGLIVWRADERKISFSSASKGVIHVNKSTLSQVATPLDGEWKFVWSQFLPAHDLDSQAGEFIRVPRMWNGLRYQNITLPAHGYSTYHLTVIADDSFEDKQLSLYIPFVHSAYTLFLQGKPVTALGKTDTSINGTVPEARTFIIPVPQFKDTLQITLHVSNFAYALGGIWQSLRIGQYQVIQSHYDKQLAFDLLVFGGLFIMSLYHIALYFMRRKVRSNLFFGLMCFFASMKNLFSGVVFFYILWPEASYEFGLKIIHISMFMTSLMLWLFLHELFKKEFPQLISKLLAGFIALSVLITLLTKSDIYSQWVLPFYMVSGVIILFIFRGIYLALKHKREGASVIFVGIFCFIITVLHDIAIDMQWVQNVYLSGAGFFMFIFSQALLLAVKFTNSFQAVENLTGELIDTNKSLSRFVPNEFLSYLKKDSITECQLSDNLQGEMTVFFSDIRSYTSISEKMSPGTNFAFINDYLGRVVHLIDENEGVVNQYLGDGILALFMHSPLDAIKAAVQIQKTVAGVQELGGFRLDYPIENGIGIHSGQVILGMLGTEQRMSAGVISDTVNTAARLEGLTKYFGAQIIISEPALVMIEDTSQFEFRFLGKIQVKGKEMALPIYEILDGLNDEQRKVKSATRYQFEQGLQSYFNRDFQGTIKMLSEVLEQNDQDKAAQLYINNAVHYLEAGVPESWEGSLKMEIK